MKQKKRSNCPVNYALETFGDTWSLLIIRDIVFWGKKTFTDFAASKEGIATNILATRLAYLVDKEVLEKKENVKDKRKSIYTLTEKGLGLIPMMLEMSAWASIHDPDTIAPKKFIEYIFENRNKMFTLITDTVRKGGSLFAGTDCVMSKIRIS
ncbi:MAG: helix-turn-helix domain-containing protein [Microgenomates group bacterium]